MQPTESATLTLLTNQPNGQAQAEAERKFPYTPTIVFALVFWMAQGLLREVTNIDHALIDGVCAILANVISFWFRKRPPRTLARKLLVCAIASLLIGLSMYLAVLPLYYFWGQ